MKRVLTLSLGLFALSAVPALAADIPMKAPVAVPVMAPAFSWTGWYVGAHAGYDWGRTSFVDRGSPAGGVNAYNTVTGDNWTNRNSGFVGGAQFGYNWQANNIVFGVEADLGYLNAKGSGQAPAGVQFFNGDTIGATNSDFYATLRGRVGIAWSQWLLYATGGGIGINTKTSVVDTCFTAPCGFAVTNAVDQSFRVGWTVGGGIEVAVGGPWSIKAEYLYYDLGTKQLSAPAFFPPSTVPTAPFLWDTKTTGNIARVGINYRFGPDAVVARY
jgi:outer membrane immunogenic protein